MKDCWDMLAPLSLEVATCELEGLTLSTASGWSRHTTLVRLRDSRGRVGVGEDVCYEKRDQLAFAAAGAERFELAGRRTLGEFTAWVGALDLFGTDAPPSRSVNRLYRRWAFESAALDLALQQAGVGLAEVLQRSRRDVEFVISLGLGSPPSAAVLDRWSAHDAGLRFKVDYAADWTPATVAALDERVAVVDLKAHYHGDFEGPVPSAEMYAAIASAMPWVWLEDPAWDGAAWDALAAARDRVTWDAVLHSLDELLALPAVPRCVNIKPSRLGGLEELFRIYAHCEAEGIAMYGGGQFELGPGRQQIQELASLFHPAMPNDVAPVEYHRGSDGSADFPASPLPAPRGFGPRSAGSARVT